MPPMLSGSIGGIRPCLTMAWKHNRMPPFCKMATRTFKICETYSVAPRPCRLFYDMPNNTQVCEYIHTWKSNSLAVRSMAFQVRETTRTWKSGTPIERSCRGCRLLGVRICAHLKLQFVVYQVGAVLSARSSAYTRKSDPLLFLRDRKCA